MEMDLLVYSQHFPTLFLIFPLSTHKMTSHYFSTEYFSIAEQQLLPGRPPFGSEMQQFRTFIIKGTQLIVCFLELDFFLLICPNSGSQLIYGYLLRSFLKESAKHPGHPFFNLITYPHPGKINGVQWCELSERRVKMLIIH